MTNDEFLKNIINKEVCGWDNLIKHLSIDNLLFIILCATAELTKRLQQDDH